VKIATTLAALLASTALSTAEPLSYWATPDGGTSNYTIAIVGDSIAEGTGRALCNMIKRGGMPLECKWMAAQGITSAMIVPLVDRKADYVVFAAGSNDKDFMKLVVNLEAMRKRVRPGANVVWINASWPVFAAHVITDNARLFGDPVVTPEFGRGSHDARVHPRSYENVALDVLHVILSMPEPTEPVAEQPVGRDAPKGEPQRRKRR